MRRPIVLFNRDLRVHDHLALHTAVQQAEHVLPLFVLDPELLGGSANRTAVLLDCVTDLRAALRQRGGDLVVASGDPVEETIRLATEHGADAVLASADVTPHGVRREARLAQACRDARLEWRTFPGVTVIPAGQLTPARGDHYRVFTPYWRAWRSTPRRPVLGAPRRVEVPAGVAAGRIPGRDRLVDGRASPDLLRGGESVARERLRAWGRSALGRYAQHHHDLDADDTSRLSAYLHFGCVSPLEIATRLGDRDDAEPFLRQLCWRDFHHQVTAAFDRIATEDYRSRGDRWRRGEHDLEAWTSGRTGYPIVDAGMRQLQREGWMHNRARLITASFLTKDLYLDWRAGARHFMRWLVDGDVASNSGNWQWVAGTGSDTRPNRVFNPLRQAERFDPDGEYVRRHLPELARVPGSAVHRPWELDPATRARIDYPDPIVDHDAAAARFRSARSGR